MDRRGETNSLPRVGSRPEARAIGCTLKFSGIAARSLFLGLRRSGSKLASGTDPHMRAWGRPCFPMGYLLISAERDADEPNAADIYADVSYGGVFFFLYP